MVTEFWQKLLAYSQKPELNQCSKFENGTFSKHCTPRPVATKVLNQAVKRNAELCSFIDFWTKG